MGRASRPVPLVAAAPGTSSPAVPIVVVAGEAAGGVTLLGLHLVGGLMDKDTPGNYKVVCDSFCCRLIK